MARRNSLVAISIVLTVITSHAMVGNPIISRGKTVYTSGGNVTFLTDNKFNGSTFSLSKDSWVAIKPGEGPSKIFFNWNDPSYAWSNEMSPSQCPNSNPEITDYDLLTSSNSTNGSDGQWTTALSVHGNTVTARGHLIDFSGKAWVKMSIINGNGRLDEIEVFDMSNGAEDIWFFPGTSISANTYKGTPPVQNFADLITQVHPAFNPVMIRGGIGCINTTDMVKNLSKYLDIAHGAHYWAIEQGTNDAWGGSNYNVATFKKNLQIVIDSCKASGINPVLARVLATNSTATNWQVNADFEKAIDDLTLQNSLIAGPDLYTWFLNHPGELNNDGVHPNASGAASIQRLWAEKMSSQYTSNSISRKNSMNSVNHGNSDNIYATVNRNVITIQTKCSGTAMIFTVNGKLINKISFKSAGCYSGIFKRNGLVLIRFVSNTGIENVKIAG